MLNVGAHQKFNVGVHQEFTALYILKPGMGGFRACGHARLFTAPAEERGTTGAQSYRAAQNGEPCNTGGLV